jgi:hypothetical protein
VPVLPLTAVLVRLDAERDVPELADGTLVVPLVAPLRALLPALLPALVPALVGDGAAASPQVSQYPSTISPSHPGAVQALTSTTPFLGTIIPCGRRSPL